MSENYIGIRYTNPKRLLDNPILSNLEAELVKEELLANVKLWGAKGDGTTDDTAAFNNALANGCDVSVPGGTYLIAGQLVFPTGAGLVGECSWNTRLSFTSNVAGALMTLQGNNNLRNFRTFYNGTNYATNTVISITGPGISISTISLQTSDTSPAYGVSFDFATQSTKISESFLHGTITCIRYTAAYERSIIYSNFLNTGTNGTVINTTNAGLYNVFTSNIMRTNGGAISYIVANIAATFISNQPANGNAAYTGTQLSLSTVFDYGTSNTVNTLGTYSVDGTRVVSNRVVGFGTGVVGANAATDVNATTITATDGNIQDLAEVVNAIKSAMITHGLIGA